MSGTQREYVTSHGWLTFQLDLSKADPALWLLLGEAQSKISHIAGALLKPVVADALHVVYLAKGAHATTAIEGNTLTEEQARLVVEGGQLRLPPSQEYQATELQNIVAAFNVIRDELLAGGPRDLDVQTIKRFDAIVLEDLDLEPEVVPGEIRTHPVVVARYRGAPPADCEYLLERLCEWLASGFNPGDRGDDWRMPFAILKAIVAHLYLAWIHPFGDGNGRTARLMEHQILLAAGVPTPATHLLSNHYNQTRAEYQRCLDAASRKPNGDLDFVMYAIRGFVEGLREQLRMIRQQQFDDRWEQYIYETFGDTKSPMKIRRRQLVLDLSKAQRPVPRLNLRTLSPALAEAYATKTTKTLSRDLNALRSMGLIRTARFQDAEERIRVGWIPCREIIEAFLPISAGIDDD